MLLYCMLLYCICNYKTMVAEYTSVPLRIHDTIRYSGIVYIWVVYPQCTIITSTRMRGVLSHVRIEYHVTSPLSLARYRLFSRTICVLVSCPIHYVTSRSSCTLGSACVRVCVRVCIRARDWADVGGCGRVIT